MHVFCNDLVEDINTFKDICRPNDDDEQLMSHMEKMAVTCRKLG